MRIKKPDSFHGRLYALLGSLAILCLLLAGLIWLQGPRIRLANLDTAAVTSLTGQRLVLHTSQPLGPVTGEQVSITPKASFDVTAAGTAVIITFAERLQYQTTYTVTIQSGGRKLRHAFTTSAPDLFYVHASREGSDEIRSRPLAGGKEKPVFSAPAIADYVVLENVLLVSTLDEQNGANGLVRVDLDTGQETQLNLPEGTVEHLYGSPDRQLAGFSFTPTRSSDADTNKLFIYDTTDGTTTAVGGFGDKPLQVADWRFAPDNATILALLLDGSAVLASIGPKAMPTPLGLFTDIGGFSYDGATVLMEDSKGALSIQLNAGTQTRLQTERTNAQAYLIDAVPLRNQDGYLSHWHAFVNDHYAEYINARKGSTEQKLFQSARDQSIAGIEQTPNGQYIALATTRLSNGTSVQEVIILRAGDGKDILRLQGSKPRWP